MGEKKPSLVQSLWSSFPEPEEHPDRLELLELTLDELETDRAEAVRDHASRCRRCQEQLRALLDMPDPSETKGPSSLLTEQWQALLRRLEDEDFPGGTVGGGETLSQMGKAKT